MSENTAAIARPGGARPDQRDQRGLWLERTFRDRHREQLRHRPTTKLTARDKAVKFAECIRAHGVSDFPDPNAKGEFDYGVSRDPRGVEAGHHRLQGPAATGHVELEADAQAAVGEPQVRPVRPRQRREGLPGPRQR